MSLEELKQKHSQLTQEADILRAKIQETTENARNLNSLNRTMLEARKTLISQAASVAAEIQELEAEENRKKLEEANRIAKEKAAEENRKLDEAKA